jgi:hypothetical protein
MHGHPQRGGEGEGSFAPSTLNGVFDVVILIFFLQKNICPLKNLLDADAPTGF